MAIAGSITIYDRTQNNADVANIETRVTEDELKTNYMRLVDDDGLHIGTEGELSEAIITESGFHVAVNGNRYTTLGGNYVRFGNYYMMRTADGGLAFRTM